MRVFPYQDGDQLIELVEKRELGDLISLLASEKSTRNAIIQKGVKLERELNAAVKALELIEDRFVDGENTYDDWLYMGTTARQFLAKNSQPPQMSDTPITDAHAELITVDCDDSCLDIYIKQDGKIVDGDIVLADFARQLERELNAAKAQRCDWKQDAEWNWDTSCERYMYFEYAPPAEQGYKFCHHCGATINFIKWTEEDQP